MVRCQQRKNLTQNGEMNKMIKLDNSEYVLHFVELGDYEDLYIDFRSLKNAEKRQQELINDHDKNYGYFTQILKKIQVRRKEPFEDEQVKSYQKVLKK